MQSCHYVRLTIDWLWLIALMRTCAMNDFRLFLRNESGATAIEYGLIAGGIALAIVAAVNSIGSALIDTFEELDTAWLK